MDTSAHEEELEAQFQQVRSRSWDITITDREPVVVAVTDETHERTHTVRPWQRWCSCSVQGDVDLFCDHLLVMLDSDGYAGALTREYLKERRNTLETTIDTEQNSRDGKRDEVERITAGLNVVDADHSMARTWVDAQTLLQGMAAVVNGTESDDIERAPTPDDDVVAYEKLVKRVRCDADTNPRLDVGL